jgi:tRNA threonylcarbamoyladenosine biosynthesis protein TsaE
MLFEKHIFSRKELHGAAKDLLAVFPGCRIFAFYGSMGAGKTTFIQTLCKVLGSDDYVTSPTFALINEYSAGNNLRIFHFDFYRIKSIAEVYDIGYEDYIFSGHFCFIEWPEKIESLLPEETVKIDIEVADDDSRKIKVRA